PIRPLGPRHSQRFGAIPEALFERKKSSGRLGPLLAWGVVFADIGTSIYYVPGLLFRELGGTSPSPAAAFVLATGVAFIFLSLKYVDVAARYPDGGGVVSVASLVVNLVVMGAVVLHLQPSAWAAVMHQFTAVGALKPWTILVGFGSSWL